MNFKAKLSHYLERLQNLRASNASEDQIRSTFLHFLDEAFPGLQFEDLNLEQVVSIAGHGAGAKVRHGFIDAVYGELIFEFKRALDEASRHKGESELAKYLANLLNPEGHFGLLTDGETVRAYALRNGYISFLDEFVLSEAYAEDAHLRLDTYLFHAKGQTPNAKDIALRFGEKSPVFRASLETLRNLWNKVKGDSDARTKFIQWQNLLALVYGSPIGDDDLFLRHTYLVYFARLMAFATLQQRPPNLSEVKGMLTGETFQHIGFPDFVAEDFFAWMDNPRIHNEVFNWLNGMALRLGASYDLSKIDEDLLKALYQELVDPATRHELGEFYTPDWLAELTLQESGYPVLDEQGVPFADTRNSLFDPSCGSGTFIFIAVRQLKKAGLRGERLIRFVQENIAGLDVHPLAVMIAKSNLILALGEDLREAREEVRLPIYMANALALAAETPVISTIPVSVDTAALEQLTGKKRNTRTLPDAFHLPFDKGMGFAYFDEALKHLISYARPELDVSTSEEGFTNVLNRLLPAEEETRKAHLSRWYPNLRLMRWLLQEPETDGVWRFILQNATRPEFLKLRKFAFIVGNPPWLAYHYIQSKTYQSFIRSLVFEHDLLKRKESHLFTQMEMATLFYAFMVWKYLANKGTLAFVMPRSVLTGAKQHQGFQKVYLRRASLLLDLKGVTPLFNVPTCVIISRDGEEAHNKIPSHAYFGNLPIKNVLWSLAKELLSKDVSAFNTSIEYQNSTYLEKILNGANLYPRVFWFVQKPLDMRVFNHRQPQLETDKAVYKQAKDPWKNIQMSGSVESNFLFATLLSDALLPFCQTNYSLVVLPLESRRLMQSDELMRKGYPGTASWVQQAERLWQEYKKTTNNLLPYLNWQKKITNQRITEGIKVIYGSAGTHITASVVNVLEMLNESVQGLTINGFIADNTTFYYDTDTTEEAYYLTAYLNSPYADAAIKPFQTQGAFGAQSGGGHRHIHRRPFEVLPFPRFNGKNPLHLKLAQLGRDAEKDAQTWLASLSEKDRNMNTGRLRSKLRAEAIAPILEEIDVVVQEILENTKAKPKKKEEQEGLF